MAVTASNWSEAVVEEWREALAGCDFVAMDTELTGLADGYRSNRADSAATRYAKNRKAAADFAITQLGLCTFTKDAATGGYVAKPLAVYVLPQDAAFMVSVRERQALKFRASAPPRQCRPPRRAARCSSCTSTSLTSTSGPRGWGTCPPLWRPRRR